MNDAKPLEPDLNGFTANITATGNVKIANDRDNGFSSHYAASLTSSFFLKLLMNNWACQSVNLA